MSRESGVAGRILRGTYAVVRSIGRGAMGTVLEAEHLRLHRRVAVKILSPEVTSSVEMRARFEREAALVSRLEHPHIVTVLDYDVTDRDEPFLVLELLHGETLADRLDRDSPLPLETALDVVTQVAAGLACAHEHGIIHRDLKPANVFLVGERGAPTFVKLLDFGIGKLLGGNSHLTGARHVIGTPEYMAPEQASGNGSIADSRADQYSLAVLAYEMLTGQVPLTSDDLAEALQLIRDTAAPHASEVAPWVPSAVDAVLARAMEKTPAARFESVTAFERALRRAATSVTDDAATSTPASATPRGDIDALVDLVRSSMHDGHLSAAASEAEAALELAERAGSSVDDLIAHAEPLLARALITHLGGAASSIVELDSPSTWRIPGSPRTAYLLSRLDLGMTIEEALDVASMPRLEALRRFAQLVHHGAVRLTH